MRNCRFDSAANESERILLSRLADLIESAEKWGKPCFSSFLNEHEQSIATQYRMIGSSTAHTFLWGGFENAQRRVFCVVPKMGTAIISLNENDYPFTALTIIFPKGYTVSHRDVLGSLMALRIKREAVGDILVGDCLAVVFLLDTVAQLVVTELTKISNVGVRCIQGMPEVLPTAYNIIECNGTVSSMRLDGVVAMLTGKSRAESVRMISQGLVQKNAQVIESVSKEVAQGDKLSVRGFGKYVITTIGSPTKKGRLRVIYHKYI